MTGSTKADLRRRAWRWFRIVAGSLLLAAGLVGLVLPILQGMALILAGLAVLATELPWAKRWLAGLRQWLRRLVGRQGPAAPAALANARPAEREERDAQGGRTAG